MELQPHRVVAAGVAGQARPAQRQLALFDVLPRGAAGVIELADPPNRPRQVGENEPDPRI